MAVDVARSCELRGDPVPAKVQAIIAAGPLLKAVPRTESPPPEKPPPRARMPQQSPSPASPDSPAPQPATALPSDSPSIHASPTTTDSPKPTTTSERWRGDSRTDHAFFDEQLSPLPPDCQLLWFHLNRYRVGGSNLTVVLSWDKLGARMHRSESTVRRAFKGLNRAGLVSKEREVYGHTGAQGSVFRLTTGSRASTTDSPTTDGSQKTPNKKDKIKGKSAPHDCPKCKGSGFWFPAGRDKGVAPCKH